MNKSSIDLQYMEIFAAFRFGIARPHSTQQSFHLQARRCFTASIKRLSWTVKGINEKENKRINTSVSAVDVDKISIIYLLWMLLGGVLVSMTHAPTGVLGLVPALPDKHVVPPKGEHARRFDFR